jgi:curved DNA-binding protein CbpA
MSEPVDYYKVMQVDRQADPKVIERVYKTLMLDLKNHPDLGGDEDRARLINTAYHTLKDPERRRAYDEELARRERPAERPAAVVRRERTPPAPPLELEDPGTSYLALCPRCRNTHPVPHSVPFHERLQCPSCHWFFRDPQRELAALRARILQLGPGSRRLAEHLYFVVVRQQAAAEEAAARGDEAAAREALRLKRDKMQLLVDELRAVRFSGL